MIIPANIHAAVRKGRICEELYEAICPSCSGKAVRKREAKKKEAEKERGTGRRKEGTKFAEGSRRFPLAGFDLDIGRGGYGAYLPVSGGT